MTYDNANDWYKHQIARIRKALSGVCIYEGYYGAILGTVVMPNSNRKIAVYSTAIAISSLVEDMSAESDVCNPDDNAVNTGAMEDCATEYWDFNVAGGWIGPGTPLLLNDLSCTDRENNAYLAKYNPRFVGFATRCSDKTYALFEQADTFANSNPGELVVPTKDIHGNPLDITIPYPDVLLMEKLPSIRRLPNAKVVPGLRKKARGRRAGANG